MASRHQVLEALEAALGIEVAVIPLRLAISTIVFQTGGRWLVEATDSGEIFGIDFD